MTVWLCSITLWKGYKFLHYARFSTPKNRANLWVHCQGSFVTCPEYGFVGHTGSNAEILAYNLGKEIREFLCSDRFWCSHYDWSTSHHVRNLAEPQTGSKGDCHTLRWRRLTSQSKGLEYERVGVGFTLYKYNAPGVLLHPRAVPRCITALTIYRCLRNPGI